KRPVEAYLGIEEILDIARQAGVDAIHPGYGFLSENADFAQACVSRGIAFIGPRPEVVKLMGDKVAAKDLARRCGVPTVPGLALEGGDEAQDARAREFFRQHAPILVKAAHGGGGRGMRVVEEEERIHDALNEARSESKLAFGSPVVFLE